MLTFWAFGQVSLVVIVVGFGLLAGSDLGFVRVRSRRIGRS